MLVLLPERKCQDDKSDMMQVANRVLQEVRGDKHLKSVQISFSYFLRKTETKFPTPEKFFLMNDIN
jgi:hypothetical protein